MAKKIFYYNEKELESIKWVSRCVDFGVSLTIISAFNEMNSALYYLRNKKDVFRFSVKKYCNLALEAASIREQELKSNMVCKSFWIDYSDHVIDEASPDIQKFRSALKKELDKASVPMSELYSYVECARVLLQMSLLQFDGVMDECKKKFGRDFTTEFMEFRIGGVYEKWNKMCDALYGNIKVNTNTKEVDDAFLNIQRKFAEGNYIQPCVEEAKKNNPDFIQNTITIKEQEHG